MINRTKHSIAAGLVTLSLLLSFSACTKENLQSQEKAIGFSHTGSDEWSIVGNTRSDDTQLTVRLDFGVYAFLLDKTGDTAPEYSPDGSTVIHMDNVHVSHNGTKYDYSPTRYWPGNSHWVKFFAYHPYSINEKTGCSFGINGGKPLIAYTNDASTDLMASAPDMFKGDYHETVILPFKHILSYVQIKQGDLPDGVSITSVSLSGIENKGEFSLAEMKWNSPATPSVSDYSITLDEPYYMMPQQLGSETTLNVQTSDGANYANDISAWKWEQGKKYIYTLNIEVTPANRYEVVIGMEEDIYSDEGNVTVDDRADNA